MTTDSPSPTGEPPKTEVGEVARCRGCGRVLRGEPYYRGKPAFHPETGEQCKTNFYGGFVCSSSCDYRASLTQEQSMPGHGDGQTRLSPYAAESHRNNWSADEHR